MPACAYPLQKFPVPFFTSALRESVGNQVASAEMIPAPERCRVWGWPLLPRENYKRLKIKDFNRLLGDLVIDR